MNNTPFDVTSGIAGEPKVTALANGNYVVAYAVQIEGGQFPKFEIRGQQFDAQGNPVGDEFTFDLQVAEGQFSINSAEFDLTTFPDGRIAVQGQVSGGDTRSAIIEFSESGPITVDAERVNLARVFANTIEGTADGGFIDFGFGTVGNNRLIRMDGTVDDIDFRDNDLTIPGGFTSNVEVDSALLGNGNIALVIDRDGNPGGNGDTRFHLAIIDPSTRQIVTSREVNKSDAARSFDPTIAALSGPDGGMVIALSEFAANDFDLHFIILNDDGSTRRDFTAFGLEVTEQSTLTSPTVVALNDGGFIIFYDKGDSPAGLRGQRFDKDGRTLGADFEIEAGKAANSPDATLLADGSVAVTYLSTDNTVRSVTVRTDQITGNDDADNINGTAADDEILGLGGDDNINGGEGDDFIDGGDDNDRLSGGAGSDTVLGGAGDDRIRAGGTDLSGDVLDGGDGIDFLDLFSDTRTTDSLMIDLATGEIVQESGSGASRVRTTAQFSNFENIFGGQGDDLIVDSRASTGGSEPATTLGGGFGDDTIDVSFRASVLFGAEGNDIIMGSEEADTIFGNSGDDFIEGGAGPDELDGGTGIDTLSYANSDTGVLFSSTNLAKNGHAEGDTFSNFEVLIGSAFRDLFNSTTLIEGITIFAGGGNDIFTLRQGGENSFGETGNDRFDAFLGTELQGSTYDGGEGNDQLRLLSNSTFNTIDLRDTAFLSVESLLFQFSGTAPDVTHRVLFSADNFEFTEVARTSVNRAVRIEIDMDDVQTFDLSGVDTRNFSSPRQTFLITGDGDAEAITGSAIADEINGNGGNDTIEGGAGADTLNGGGGFDTLSYAGSSAAVNVDLFRGTASGGDAEGDVFSSFDVLIGSDFDDTLAGRNGGFVAGGAGDDRLLLNRGAGLTDYDGGTGTDTFDLSNFDRSQFIDLANEFYDFGTFVFTRVDGSLISVENYIGGGGDEFIIAGSSANMIDGGEGRDTVSYEAATAGVTASLARTGSGGDAAGDTLTNIENLIGSAFADALAGNGGHNEIDGGDGDDTLEGASGRDTLTGGDGADILIGGAGDDLLIGDGGQDTAQFAGSAAGFDIVVGVAETVVTDIDLSDGDEGQDTLVGIETISFADGTTSGDDTIVGTADDELILGLDGNDSLEGGAGLDTLDGGAGDDTAKGGREDDTIRGGSGDDLLIGNNGFDLLEGGGGHDELRGGFGEDVLDGGAGNDTLKGEDLNDSLLGGDGEDRLEGGFDRDTLRGGNDDDFLHGNNGRDSLFGDAGDDELRGGLGNDTLDGGTGNDTIRGNENNDLIDGASGDDLAEGGAGRDTIFGGEGMDTLFGNGGVDQIFGGDGADGLSGGNADDTLDGGLGNDTMIGGMGDDVFIGGAGDDLFVIAGISGDDTIEGFEAGAGTEDVIQLFTAEAGIDSLGDVVANATESFLGTTINLGGGNTLFLEGVAIADLHEDDFIFA